MDDELLSLMRMVDTPTVCNAIEVAQGKRGFDGFTRGTVVSSAPTARPVVGYARTAKIAAAAPSTEGPAVIKARRMDYYRHMASGDPPSVAVVEDMDYPHCVGAFWGEINATVHRGLGLCGVLTNGVMRDLGDVPEDFPMIAGSVGPSHAFVHVEAIGVPVSVFGLTVAPGDLVHADRHGAVVVPPDIIPVLAAAIEKLRATERLILEPARQQGFDLAKFEEAWARFEAART
ncbi:RraA family protein [Sinorhizobium medicae]|uniref:Putative 4-hydroxy-4-methyl-2-oxoglutarate aldolase n=2 Tax=Sinorhizobium medicae TaxID=110321 RepID=A0A6G1WWR8_9HYPH|nr:RraA family protein [Sinorhizobium medicae]MBO1942791.1 RraA family protein [Sinorhizobium medicae]MDX0403595.1 RraA family protein [Sinorhizobium medicae]MDX0409401.1 RraA family protein [Sinorhizobium medicae]MDX0415516.1 RraA family protein [Sinorhizobium medicae]MDX0427541.1 RraA family protein [Sinorhizobium medicae]